MPIADYFPAPVTVATSLTPASAVVTPVLPNSERLTGCSLQIRNLAGGDLTAVSVDVSYDGATYGPARSVTAGLPLAPGEVLPLDILDTVARSYRVTLTADDDGSAAVDFLGEPALRRPVTALRVDGSEEPADGVTGASGTGASGATAPAFTGTAPAVAATDVVTGSGYSTSGQVVTTTDNQTLTLDQLAGCWLHTATHAPCLIVSHPACTGAPAAFTVFGAAPATTAEAYRVTRAPTPAGSVASHTHTGPSHTHTVSGLS